MHTDGRSSLACAEEILNCDSNSALASEELINDFVMATGWQADTRTTTNPETSIRSRESRVHQHRLKIRRADSCDFMCTVVRCYVHVSRSYIYIYICMYIYIYRNLDINKKYKHKIYIEFVNIKNVLLNTHMYMHTVHVTLMYVFVVCTYTYIHIYIYRERETDILAQVIRRSLRGALGNGPLDSRRVVSPGPGGGRLPEWPLIATFGSPVCQSKVPP